MIEPRSLVLWNHLGKRRPAIVLQVRPDTVVIIIPGTGTQRPHYDYVEVLPETREGRALQLGKPTYFYSSHAVAVTTLSETGRRCPPELFLRLSAFAAEHAAQE